MTQYVINIGALPNDGTGDPLRTAFNEVNLNFNQVWATGLIGSNIQIANNTILTSNTNGNLILNPNGIGSIIANAHVIPDQNRIRNLGSSSRYWDSIYVWYANVGGNLNVSGGITVAGPATIDGNVLINGNLQVEGNVTFIDSNVVDIKDKNITLAYGSPNAQVANGGGITIAGANAQMYYNYSGNNWTFNLPIATANIQFPDGSVLDTANTVYIGQVPNDKGDGNLWFNSDDGRGYVKYNDQWIEFSPTVIPNPSVYLGNLTINGNNNSTLYFPPGGEIVFGDDTVQTTAWTGTANVDFTNISSNIIPSANITYSLGNATNQWKDLWVSNATIYINSVPLTIDGTTLQVDGANVVTTSNVGQANIGNLEINGATVQIAAGAPETYIDISSSGPEAWAYLQIPTDATANSSNVRLHNDAGNIEIAAGDFSNSGPLYQWYFNKDGNLTFPDSTVQTTAYPGTATDLSLSGNISAGTNIGATGNLTAGGILDIDGNARVGGNLVIVGNIDFSGGGSINQIVSANGVFTGNAEGAGALYAGTPGYTPVPDSIAQFTGDANKYQQINAQNLNHGNVASMEYVITGDLGTDTTDYLDIGFAGSGWDGTQDNSLGTAVKARDGYMYVQGGGGGGNLVIGTTTAGRSIKFNAGGPGSANTVADISNTGITTTGVVSATGNVRGSNLNTAGQVSAAGNVTGNYILGNVAFATGIPATTPAGSNTYVQFNDSGSFGGSGGLTFDKSSGNLDVSGGFVNAAAVVTSGRIEAGTSLSAVGNVTSGNILTAGLISATGNITGNYVLGNAAFMSGIPASYGNSNVVALMSGFGSNTINTTGNIYGGNIITPGSVSATGNINAGNVIATNLGNVSALNLNGNASTVLYGNGVFAAPAASSSYGNSNVATFLAAFGSNTISTSGNITAGNIIGNISITGNVTGTSSNVQLVAGSYTWTFDNTGNLSLPGNTFAVNYANGAQVSLGGGSSYGDSNVATLLGAFGSNTVSTTGNITAGNLTISGVTSLTGNITSSGYFISGNQATGGFKLGNVNSRIAVGGGNSYMTFGQNPSIYPDTSASVNAGVLIGGNGYLLAPNGSRVLTLQGTGNVDVTTSLNLPNGGQVSTTGNVSGGNLNVSGSITRSGNFSQPSWTTSGIGLKLPTAVYNETTAPGGTVANSYIHNMAAPTLTASNATVYTNYATLFVAQPTPSTNVTITNNWAIMASGNISASGNVTVSGAGAISTPNRPGFRVYGNGVTSVSTTTNTNGVLNGNNWAVDYNQGSYLNSTTGTFTAPVAGLYQVSLNMRVSNNIAPTAQAIVIKNYGAANTAQAMWEAAANCTVNHFGVSTISKLAVGDTLTLVVAVGALTFDQNDSWSVAFLG